MQRCGEGNRSAEGLKFSETSWISYEPNLRPAPFLQALIKANIRKFPGQPLIRSHQETSKGLPLLRPPSAKVFRNLKIKTCPGTVCAPWSPLECGPPDTQLVRTVVLPVHLAILAPRQISAFYSAGSPTWLTHVHVH